MSLVRQRRIVEMISEQTKEGSLAWTKAVSSGSYIVVIGKNTIQLSSESDGVNTDYRITVFDRNGESVDTFLDTDIEQNDENLKKTFYPMMIKLYEDAQRRATGADKVLDDIIAELSSPF